MNARKSRFSWWAGAAMTSGLIAGSVWAQPPNVPHHASPGCQRQGALHRLIHHSAHKIHDRFIGYPETFFEPPLGAYVHEQFTLQVAKADPHRFTLYRSDFLPGTNQFSPTGAARFNLIYNRLNAWLGPITVEWTPDQPGLAEARRQAVLATLQRGGQSIVPERVVIGPSPYPGAFGQEAADNFGVFMFRSQQAQLAYPLTPAAAAYTFSTGAQ